MTSIMKAKTFLQKTAAVVFTLAVWQTAASFVDQKILLASPFSVFKRLATIWFVDGFIDTIWFSFSRIVGGFLFALILGILMAVAAGKFKFFEILFWPFMITIKSVPVASFIVISLIWLSSRQLSVFISFLMVLPIIYTNVLNGIKNTDKQITEMADLFHMRWHRRIIYIWLPHIKPFLLSACSVALGLSWKAGIAAEVIGIPDGSIGEMLYEAKIYLNTTDLFAWTVIIIIISILFEKAFMLLLRGAFKRLERM